MIFAGTNDHFFEVKSSLKNLDSDKLRDLGGALGLHYPNLKRMTNILDGMIEAWLNKENDVLDKSGEPTWSRLVEALEKIGQRGVAEDIKRERRLNETEQPQEMPTKGMDHLYSPHIVLHVNSPSPSPLPSPPPPPPHTHTH